LIAIILIGRQLEEAGSGAAWESEPFPLREIQPPVILNLPWQVKNPLAASRLDGVWGFFNR
jgi:hypothetical protein